VSSFSRDHRAGLQPLDWQTIGQGFALGDSGAAALAVSVVGVLSVFVVRHAQGTGFPVAAALPFALFFRFLSVYLACLERVASELVRKNDPARGCAKTVNWAYCNICYQCDL
jgi:hypothetical protein